MGTIKGEDFEATTFGNYFYDNNTSTDVTSSSFQFLPAKTTAELIEETLEEIKDLLLEKNEKYGDSALSPARVFSKSDHLEQIKVRIDDKISRIRNDVKDEEDTITDLVGYLILLLVAKKK